MGSASSKVDIYWNLRKGLWSLKDRGIVRYHARSVMASDISFVVQAGGRARVLATSRKNVHAFVRAGCVDLQTPYPIEIPEGYLRVRYNPYSHTTFVTEGDIPIYFAEEVILTDGRCYAKV